jgi:putative DNA primase/helicase
VRVNGHSASHVAAAPRVYDWGDCGPPVQADELRRHSYLGSTKIKIKYNDGFKTWYRVGAGWQAKKPENFQPVPYVTAAIDPFDPELKDDQIFWPEGEKDVDSLSKKNLLAFTFGGVGDGLPDDIEIYLSKRHLIILVDNDDTGRKHGERKAALAHSAGAVSIRIIGFPELATKADVSDFFAGGGTAEDLIARIDVAPLWAPQRESRRKQSQPPLVATRPKAQSS